MSLQEKLAAFKADFEAGKPPYNMTRPALELMHRATAELRASGAADRAIGVGDTAPAFELKGSHGDSVSSEALLRKGPLIVSFYRGIWCPYCNIELQALQAALPKFEQLNASLVAISPQTIVNSRRSSDTNKLSFPILCDSQNKVAERFNLMFTLPDYLADLYRAAKIDLSVFNADPSWTLPMPARYVIGQDGVIAYADVNPDYTLRPEPEAVLPALQKMVAAQTSPT